MRFWSLLIVFVVVLFLLACTNTPTATPVPTSKLPPPPPSFTPLFPVLEYYEPVTQPALEFPTFAPPPTTDWNSTMISEIPTALYKEIQGPVIEASKHALTLRIGVSYDQITVLSVESEVWEDTCMEITSYTNCQPFGVPGFRIILQASNQVFEYHTNFDGSELGLAH